jgi:hypothetical protein
MPADERAELAARQAELVRALTGGGPMPAGFLPSRIQATADALAAKRARSAARAWPALAAALGDQFRLRFAEYAAVTRLPQRGGPLADGRAFADWLARRGALPDAGRLEALAIDLGQARCAGGLVPRRGPALAAAWLRQSGRLAIGLRWPGAGERWVVVPLGRSRAH